MVSVSNIRNLANYLIKHGKSILIDSNRIVPQEYYKYTTETIGAGKTVLSQETKVSLGNASLWIDSLLKAQLPEARAEVQLMFSHLPSVERTMHRAKGALSIEPKLLKSLEKEKVFTSFQDAVNAIGDGIGSRVITKSLKKLSDNEIHSMINNLKIEGRELTAREKQLLKKYVYNEPLERHESEQAFKLYEKFAEPLIEKRNDEVVNELTAGILKFRLDKGEFTLEELKKSGMFNEKLIERIETGDVMPMNITVINNYRGEHGLPEFTNRQIQRLVKATGFNCKEPITIYSDPRGLDYSRYTKEEINKIRSKSIKSSGYRTAQMNIMHSNGAFGEIQFRGKYTNLIGEYEHIAYDLRQNKNTLGPIFQGYADAIGKLDEKKYKIYNKYLESCYNYYNRIELGLPAKKPLLPKGFNPILSEENMKRLHDLSEAESKKIAKTFSPHLMAVA